MKSTPSNDRDSQTRRVLIVDSQQMTRLLLCRMLKSWGLCCQSASDLMSACSAVLSEGPFEAVVCDHDLPDGNARGLIAFMREGGLMTPTVVTVGSPALMTKPEAGVEQLAKPFDPLELRSALERLLGIDLRKEAGPAPGKESAAIPA